MRNPEWRAIALYGEDARKAARERSWEIQKEGANLLEAMVIQRSLNYRYRLSFRKAWENRRKALSDLREEFIRRNLMDGKGNFTHDRAEEDFKYHYANLPEIPNVKGMHEDLKRERRMRRWVRILRREYGRIVDEYGFYCEEDEK